MKVSLNYLFCGLAVVPLLVVSIVFTEYLGIDLRYNGEEQINHFRETLLQRKRNQLKSSVGIACCAVQKYFEESESSKVGEVLRNRGDEFRDTLQRYYDTYKDILPKETIQQFIINFVKAYRFDEGVGYFWINDFHPTMICHPVSPGLDDIDLSTYKDSQGVFLFNKAVEVCKAEGSGFVDYAWMNKASGKEEQKRSYVVVLKPFNWIIGTGEHLSVLRTRLEKNAISTIEKLRYDGDNYFWINDFSSKMIMHPAKPELVGKDLSDFKSPDGTLLFPEFVKAGRANGEGYVNYLWPRPGSKEPVAKMACVTAFEPWQWIIGTGEYIDDIDQLVVQETKRVHKEVNALVWQLRLFAIPLVFVVVCITLMFVTKYVISPLGQIVAFLVGFDNDLTRTLPGSFRFEYSTLAEAFNSLLASLKVLVGRIFGATVSIDATVGSITAQVECQSAQLSQQFAAINEITATVEELSASSEQIAANAAKVQYQAESSMKRSIDGTKAMKSVAGKMEEIHRDNKKHKTEIDELRVRTDQVSSVMELISDIAEQTKLIAFNAALEASSAGVEGRRFKVVAGEIRNLTDRVMEATYSIDIAVKDIQSLSSRLVASTDKSISGVEKGMEVTLATSLLLEDIVRGTKETSTSVRQITLSTQQQRSASTQIVVAMREIKDGAAQTSSAVKSVREEAVRLEDLSKELSELVSRFKI